MPDVSARPNPCGPIRTPPSRRMTTCGMRAAVARRAAVALGAGQRVDGGQRRAERGPVFRADPVQDHGQPLGPDGPAPGQRVPALVGQPDLDNAPVIRVRLPPDQAGALQPGDQLGHGGLGHALLDGEPGQPPRSRPLQRGQRRRRGKRQPVGRGQRPHQPDQPLHPGRDPGPPASARPARPPWPPPVLVLRARQHRPSPVLVLPARQHRPPPVLVLRLVRTARRRNFHN